MSLLAIVNGASKGAVGRKVTKLRGEGRTYDEIARTLAAQGVNVSRTTVMEWCRELGAEKGARS